MEGRICGGSPDSLSGNMGWACGAFCLSVFKKEGRCVMP